MRDPKAQAVMGPFMQGMAQNSAAADMAEAQENDTSGAVNQEMMAAMPLKSLISFGMITLSDMDKLIDTLNQLL